ncbi:oligosaccharide repeat unit polymerase [Coleofasciculus sp. LEGE 07081]|nr:O-antigen polymerase [Coleofasciculus sp. LEGE 07081]MBE9129853.1 oligosaccharide repeat unit polymerase [Coleofasciculus sp. LEGE 07081]
MEIIEKMVVFLIISFGMIFSILRGYALRGRVFVDPVFIFGLFIVVYLIIADFFFWLPRGYFWVGRDFSSFYINSYYASAVSFVVFSLSFYFFLNRVSRKFSYNDLGKMSLASNKIFLFGIISIASPMLAITVTGGQVGLIDGVVGVEFSRNSLVSYSLSIISFAIASSIVLFAVGDTKKALILVLLYTFVSYLLGFRFRVALLFLSVALFYINYSSINFKRLFFIIFFCSIGLLVVSLLGVVRVAGKGVDFEKLTDVDLTTSFSSGILNDTNIYLTTALGIEERGNSLPYRGLEEFFYIFIHPIPRSIWESKPYFSIDSVELIGTFEAYTSGAAYSLIGSIYNIYGYLSILFFFLIFGFYFAKIYTKDRLGYMSGLHYNLICSIVTSWFFYANTRGYLPQITQDLVFMLLPIWLFRFPFFRR